MVKPKMGRFFLPPQYRHQVLLKAASSHKWMMQLPRLHSLIKSFYFCFYPSCLPQITRAVNSSEKGEGSTVSDSRDTWGNPPICGHHMTPQKCSLTENVSKHTKASLFWEKGGRKVTSSMCFLNVLNLIYHLTINPDRPHFHCWGIWWSLRDMRLWCRITEISQISDRITKVKERARCYQDWNP